MVKDLRIMLVVLNFLIKLQSKCFFMSKSFQISIKLL